MHTEFQSKGVKFIGINVFDGRDARTKFLGKGFSYPQFIADDGTLMASLGHTSGGLPFTVLLNKSGEVKKTYTGLLNEAELRNDILALL